MFDLGDMQKRLGSIPERAESALMLYGKTAAAGLHREAVKNRPWTDRTAHAKQRLKGYCERTDTGVRIYLAHGVSYGVDLEFKHEKRYAIVYPTLRQNAPKIMAGCRKLIGGIRG